jgi:hypothetical protein
VGNESAYSDPPAYTDIDDNTPPFEAHVEPLPSIQTAPFPVSWWGSDACTDVVAYQAQYSVGSPDAWQDWPGHPTPNSSDIFDPATPAYGETYHFRVRVQDAAGNWSDPSTPLEAYTILAQFSLEGWIYNIRHQPVAATEAQITPEPLWLSSQPAGFLAYTATSEDLDIVTARDDLYGPLPTMLDVPVNDDIHDLAFILPPQDDAVTDGDFEAGDLTAWQVGGTVPPTLTTVAHTGTGASLLDGSLSDSRLSQVLTPALGISDPTLSFLVRLAVDGPPSTLQIELANTGTLSSPLTYTLPVEDSGWTHVWYDLTGLASEPLTLTFAVSDSPAVLLDEVRLGSSLNGSHWTYLPLVNREG